MYDIRLVKLINGDMVLGKWMENERKIKDVAMLQTLPTQQGVQMVLLPFGYPFETDVEGEISFDHVLYKYNKFPDELKTKYLEACTKLTISSPADLTNLRNTGGNISDISRLLKK